MKRNQNKFSFNNTDGAPKLPRPLGERVGVRGQKEIKVKCPAKINLTLEILNKREDGFHNIQSVMQTIDLFDILTINIEPSEQFEIKLSGTSDEIPYDERNLVHKAICLFVEELDYSSSPPVGEDRGEGVQCLSHETQVALQEEFNNIIRQGAKNLRQESTPAENIIWYYLRAKRFLGLKFKRQVPIKNYIVDFVCFDENLIIELDGSQHLQDKSIKYDIKRDDFLKSQNFKILKFFNDEIYNNIEGVLEKIYNVVFNNDIIYSNLEPPLPQPLSHGGRGERTPHKISVHIEKNIPISAGLAGGSTDAAGALWGLNKLFDNVLTEKELHNLCAQLGSDLNFCLEGGCQLTTGRGEILEKLEFTEFNLSLIKPRNIGISAKEAYTKFSELENKPNLNMTQRLVESVKSEKANVKCFLHNDLEIAVINDYKELQEIKKAYSNSIMSGSGSTFFILEKDIEPLGENFWIKTNLKSISYGACEL